MNKIFLIGNGFDLAHGLKTRYSDFLLWYINKSMQLSRSSSNLIYEDGLIRISKNDYPLDNFLSLVDFLKCRNNGTIEFKCLNNFLNRILENSDESKWVDIEYEYFCSLLRLYRDIERHNKGKNDGIGAIRQINKCFELLKFQLIEYLRTISTDVYNDTIELKIKGDLAIRPFNAVLFLVFNYTNTIESYLKFLKIPNSQVIYIHGQLDDENNPIIFGYGDEMNEYYEKIESLNINEFLENFKSFNYLKTTNLQKLNGFLDSENYKISIMGHSCGISDRVLLNSIFCHKNSQGIQIYYYNKKDGNNDYFEKTQQISRHFRIEEKSRMRSMIMPLPNSTSLS